MLGPLKPLVLVALLMSLVLNAGLVLADPPPLLTLQVKEINPGSGGSFPVFLTAVKATLLFRANDGTTGRGLWKSDGTAAGTVRVKDIDSGPASSSPFFLTAVNGTLFFRANDGITGFELWKSAISR